MGTLGSSRISEAALIEPAASVPEVTMAAVAGPGSDPAPTSAANAVLTMRVIDDAYRAAGLAPRPS